MEEEFVPYIESDKIKELGFDKPCIAYYALHNVENKLFFDIDPDNGKLIALNQNQFYHNNLSEVGRISAPTWKQAFEFFREKYNLEITTNIIVTKPFSTLPINKTYSFTIVKTDEVSTSCTNKTVGIVMDIATPEELNVQSLEKLIEIAKKINIGLRI